MIQEELFGNTMVFLLVLPLLVAVYVVFGILFASVAGRKGGQVIVIAFLVGTFLASFASRFMPEITAESFVMNLFQITPVFLIAGVFVVSIIVTVSRVYRRFVRRQ